MSAFGNNFRKNEVENVHKLDVLRNICNGLSEQHHEDALQLWTAELGNIRYFLSADRKFMRAVGQNNKLRLHCQLLSPADLLDALGIAERDSWPFDPDRLYFTNGRPAPAHWSPQS